MYLDKLDGRIDAEFFDSKAAEWRAEQARIASDFRVHQNATEAHLEEGIRLLALARRAHQCSKINRRAKKGNFWISYFRTVNGGTENSKCNTATL
jgi:site-specific DNA recombinase